MSYCTHRTSWVVSKCPCGKMSLFRNFYVTIHISVWRNVVFRNVRISNYPCGTMFLLRDDRWMKCMWWRNVPVSICQYDAMSVLLISVRWIVFCVMQRLRDDIFRVTKMSMDWNIRWQDVRVPISEWFAERNVRIPKLLRIRQKVRMTKCPKWLYDKMSLTGRIIGWTVRTSRRVVHV
jgi:hypothetical protein